jgi:hypothetical protein
MHGLKAFVTKLRFITKKSTFILGRSLLFKVIFAA